MTIELSEAQRKALEATALIGTPEEFNLLKAEAEKEMGVVVREVMEPSQAMDTTITELRDLYLTVTEHESELGKKMYGAARVALFRDAIRLADTACTWFGAGVKEGSYRVRTVEEVVAESRPWRAEIAAIGAHAFVFEPDIAEQFEDVNSSSKLDEEKQDLAALNALLAQHESRLAPYGLTAALMERGRTLLAEAQGRDIAGIVGIRNLDEALMLRDRLLTYAVNLGKEARAAGINACFHDEKARRRFQKASFRAALRRLRGGKRSASSAAAEPSDPAEPSEPVAPPGPSGGETPSN